MLRCLQLAELGSGHVAPNPMVGAVLVYEERILAEGYHRQYGQSHAEVNCINNVAEHDTHLIPKSTLYVSLEPCNHFGKTPPCADLIIQHRIPMVVIGTRDPFKAVDGKGLSKLQAAGIDVVTGVLKDRCVEINKRFFTFHQQQRPYVILKWAQTANGLISSHTTERLRISNEYTNRMVHKWRSEEAAILVGTNTALQDNPALSVRLWTGNNPVRLIVDKNLRLPSHLEVFNAKQRTIVFNTIKHEETGDLFFYKINRDGSLVQQILSACYQLNIQSILVEGGAKLLQSFIDEGTWDESRIITNTALVTVNGIGAPLLNAREFREENILTDRITYFANDATNT